VRGGSLQRSPNALAGFKGLTSKRRKGRWTERGEKGEEREEEGKGRGICLLLILGQATPLCLACSALDTAMFLHSLFHTFFTHTAHIFLEQMQF